jgi:tetratricopeptide (TPR) repeat protein
MLQIGGLMKMKKGKCIMKSEKCKVKKGVWVIQSLVVFILSSVVWAGPNYSPAQEPTVSVQEAKVLRQVAELAESDPAAAVALFASEITSESSAALDFALGNLNVQQGRLEEAEAAYRAALERFPTFARARMHLAQVLIRQEKLPQVAEVLRPVLTSGQARPETFTLLGYSFLLQGQSLPAETAYRQALLLKPDDVNNSFGLAKCLLEQERTSEAIRLLENLVEREPKRSELWLLLANAHLALEKPDQAIVKLECARRLGIASTEALATLGDLYLNCRQPVDALSAYEEAFAGKSPPLDRLLRSAEGFLMLGMPAEAECLLQQARRVAASLRPGQRRKLLRLEARQAYLSGDRTAAHRAYERLLEEYPLDGDALIALGDLHREAGALEEAMMAYERAGRISGKEAQALVRQAQVEVERERYVGAVERLEAAQVIDPRLNVTRYLGQVRRLVR